MCDERPQKASHETRFVLGGRRPNLLNAKEPVVTHYKGGGTGAQSSCQTVHRSRSSTSSMPPSRRPRVPEVKKLFEEQGTEAAGSTQAEMTKILRENFARLGDVAKGLGLKMN